MAVVPVALLRQGRASGQLNLSNRQLSEVPVEVWRINVDAGAQATSSGDALSFDAEDRWWEQAELQRLVLACNVLSELADGVGELASLVALDLHENKIARLSPRLGELTHLASLNLSHNSLAGTLPSVLLSLTQLRSLRLAHNELDTLPEALGSLKALEELVRE